MKKYIIVFCVCFVQYSYSQIIALDKIQHDFGIISEKTNPVEALFTVSNLGDKPLIITSVIPECPCTSVEFSKDSIAPGNKGYIHVYFNSQGYNSIFYKRLKVYSNSIEGQDVSISVKGTVKQIDVSLEQKYQYSMENVIRVNNPSLNLGVIKSTEIKKDTVYIYNPQDTVVTIIFPTNQEFLKAEVFPSPILQPNQEAKIIITYDPIKRNDWGSVFDKLYFGYEGRKMNYKSRIGLSAVIQEDFSQLTPAQLKNAPHITFEKTEYNFDTITQGKNITIDFSFKNTGKSPLVIHKVKTSCGCTGGKPEKTQYEKGESGKIQVTFDSTHKQQNVNQRITIVTNDPEHPNFDLTIKGYVKVSPFPSE